MYNQHEQFGESGVLFGPVGESEAKNNIVIDSASGWTWNTEDAEPHDLTIRHNVFINSDIGQPQYEPAITVTENAFYNAQPFDGDNPKSIDKSAASAAHHEDLTVRVREITGPKTVTIPNAKVTSSSPHAEWFRDN
ncbi:MAG: hypothetical protein ABEN55_03110 [Bradymonadaceae bacterium]